MGVAAAGVAVATVHQGGGGNSLVPYGVAFLPSPPGINVSACGFANGFSGGVVQADSNGNLDGIFNPPTSVLRVAGHVTSTTFQAALTCINGAQSGSLSATGTNGTSYSGTFQFGPSGGQVTINKQ